MIEWQSRSIDIFMYIEYEIKGGGMLHTLSVFSTSVLSTIEGFNNAK